MLAHRGFLALIFVYLFLVAQYGSWSIPAAIILVVPMAIGGAIAALLVGTLFIPGFYAIVQTTREKVKRKLGFGER